jgi:hypothetical protein
MNQLDMFPTISLGLLDALLHSPGIAEDTATRATTNVPATLQYATSIARVSLRSATLTRIAEWSRGDAHHWSRHGLRTLYRYDMGWAMLLGRRNAVYAMTTTSLCAEVCNANSDVTVRIDHSFEKRASIYRGGTNYHFSLDTSPA